MKIRLASTLLISASLVLAPSFVSSAGYTRSVSRTVIVEQRGDHTYVVPTSRQHRAICKVVDKYRHPRKGIDPVEFAQAVGITTLPLLLTAVARAESTYVKTAKNRSGAFGLFQVMPSVWGEPANPHSAAEQAQQAEKIMLHYLKINRGRLRPALIGYLGGEGKGSKYVSTVLKTYAELKQERG